MYTFLSDVIRKHVFLAQFIKVNLMIKRGNRLVIELLDCLTKQLFIRIHSAEHIRNCV